MDKQTEQDILNKAVKIWGKEAQMIVAVEELSELIKELTKNLRGNENTGHISEEMADVYIMLSQLEKIFGNADEIQQWKEKKILRMSERLGEGK